MLYKLRYEEVKFTENHFLFLYKSLNKRVFSVSHKILPDYQSHINFVKKHPYRKWFLIFSEENCIGSFYLAYDNAIGLNIEINSISINQDVLSHILLKFKPLKGIKSVRSENFYINIAIMNKSLEKSVDNIGGILTQKCYKLIN